MFLISTHSKTETRETSLISTSLAQNSANLSQHSSNETKQVKTTFTISGVVLVSEGDSLESDDKVGVGVPLDDVSGVLGVLDGLEFGVGSFEGSAEDTADRVDEGVDLSLVDRVGLVVGESLDVDVGDDPSVDDSDTLEVCVGDCVELEVGDDDDEGEGVFDSVAPSDGVALFVGVSVAVPDKLGVGEFVEVEDGEVSTIQSE